MSLDVEAKLDGRLRAACAMVRKNTRVADVGTDHGYLICHLALTGAIRGGVACDINAQPLAAAARLIDACGLRGRVQTRLCDGLSAVLPNEADDIVICGMGGELIESIVHAAPWLQNPDKRLILQPMTRADTLRRALARMGFETLEERGARAGRFAYAVLCAAYTGRTRELDALEAYAGRLPASPSPEAKDYLLKTAARLHKAARGLEKSDTKSIKAESYYTLCEQLRRLAEEGGGL